MPIADNRNLSGDKPFNNEGLEQANRPVRHEQAKGDARRAPEVASGNQPGSVPGAPADPFASPNTASGQSNDSSGPANVAPSTPPNTEVRQSIFSRLIRPKAAQGEADAFDAPEFKEKKKEKNQPSEQTVLQEKAKAKEKIKAALSKTAETAAGSAQKKQAGEEKKAELPKTFFGNKSYIKKDDIKYNLWKSDEMKNMTKLGRKGRSELAKEFFPDRHFVRKEDVQKTIRGIEKGQIKPPKALGSGRIGRTRATNVLRGMIGEKQKRVY